MGVWLRCLKDLSVGLVDLSNTLEIEAPSLTTAVTALIGATLGDYN